MQTLNCVNKRRKKREILTLLCVTEVSWANLQTRQGKLSFLYKNTQSVQHNRGVLKLQRYVFGHWVVEAS